MYFRCSSLLLLFSVATALTCNICGPGNTIGEQAGVVTLVYEGVERKQNCQKWQDSNLISEEWCQENMLDYTKNICKCIQSDGTLLIDLIEPTASPAPTQAGPPPTPRNPVVNVPTTSPPVGGGTSSATRLLAHAWMSSALVLGGVAVAMGL
jgi:hypothetical protein